MELDPKALFVQAFNFLLMFIIFSKFFYRPLANLIEERIERIKKEQEDIRRIKAEAMEEKDEYERKLRKIKEESQEVLFQARQQAEGIRNEIISGGKEEVKRLKELAQEEIIRERDKAALVLRNQTINLAAAIASKFVQLSIDQDTQQRITEEIIEKIGDET